MIELLAGWLTALLAAAGATGIFLAMMIESACVPLPSEVILPFSGILVSQGTIPFWSAVTWAMLGQVTGSVLTYYVGLYGGRPFIERYGKYVLIRKHEMDLAERYFAKYGEITAFVARLLPGVRTFISLPAGFARMPLWRFLLYSALGALPWTIFLIWAGTKVGRVWENPKWHPYFRGAEVVVLLALVALVGWFFISRVRESRRKR